MKNTKSLTLLPLFFLFLSVMPLDAAGLLAFPGAEGFGRFAVGGRGGIVYHVTNLNDSGKGSFRDAISSPNRIIVFDVSGVIKVTTGNPLIFSKNLTILGQTAPGEGVQIYGERVSFSGADNIIVRYLRLRMGTSGTSGKDAAGVANGSNMIFDHLSVLWGKDENFSVSWDNKGTEPANVTIQNSIIGQGLQTHSCGGLIQTNGGVTLFRNLYIENKTRNPKVKGLNQYVNNVVYNWGNGGCYIMGDTEANSWAHIENNYFINGPWEGATDAFTRGTPTFTYYGKGNYFDVDQDGTLDGHIMTADEYSGSTAVSDFVTWDNSTARPQAHPVIAGMMSAQDAVAWIIDSVGPCLPARDQVDSYLIDELKSFGKKGTTNGISSEKTLPHGGTGVLFDGNKPTDSDTDGIPDLWETANGLNPNDASDATAIALNGYANIENYANTICAAYPYIKSPSAIISKGITTSSIKISWTDNSSDEKGFYVEQSTDGTVYTVMDTVPADSVFFLSIGLAKETKYYFRVRAFNDDLVSSYSPVFSVYTYGDPAIPAICTNPFPSDSGTTGAVNGLKLAWSNSSNIYGGPLYYSIYFGTHPDSLELIKDSLLTNSYSGGTLNTDLTYYWRVDTKNNVGITKGEVWTFTALEGGNLFYTDFNTTPTAFYTSYGSTATTTNIINSANAGVNVGGMTFGSGSNSIRICYIPQGAPTSTSENYGPYTLADSGSTKGCIQFYTKSAGAYLKLPEVQGPCTITIWAGNAVPEALTFNLNAIINGTDFKVASFSMVSAKRAFKFQYTYLGSEKIIFKVDANGNKFNLNDVLIETFHPVISEEPLAFTSTPDSIITYADGASMKFSFNQTINYNGGITLNGEQYENIAVTGGTGTMGLAVDFTGLDANTEYILSFPEGAITDFANTKSFEQDLTFTTQSFPALKVSGDTHYGKAATALPLDFKPFDVVAPFTTSGSLVQTKSDDYPHWITAGFIAADSVIMTSTSNKIMGYFNSKSRSIRLKANYLGSGNVVLKVQETTNPDVSPAWRTIRVFTTSDFPFDQELYLNPDSRFIKIVPTTLSSGSVIVKELQLSDAQGSFPVSLAEIHQDLGVYAISGNKGMVLKGINIGMCVEVYDVTGKLLKSETAHSERFEINLPKSLYIVRVREDNFCQIIKAVVM